MKTLLTFTFLLLFYPFISLIAQSPGEFDPDFGTDGIVTTFDSGEEESNAIIVQPDGKILIAVENNIRVSVFRFNTDGSVDTSFNHDGFTWTNVGAADIPQDIALQPDNKIVVAGISIPFGDLTEFGIVRYHPDGTLDSSFSGDGKLAFAFDADSDYGGAYAVAIQPDGKIVLGGTVWGESGYDFAIARLNADGTFDESFDDDGKVVTDLDESSFDIIYDIALQDDGKLVVVGVNMSAADSFVVVRYLPNGALDSEFDGDGKAFYDFGGLSGEVLNDVLIQPDGKILAAGAVNNGVTMNFALVRLLDDGSPDLDFNGTGYNITSFPEESYIKQIGLLSDGKIVAAGKVYVDFDFQIAIASFTQDGILDNEFNGDGKLVFDYGEQDCFATALAIQNDDKILATGSYFDGTDFAGFIARVFPVPAETLSVSNVNVPVFEIFPNPTDGNLSIVIDNLENSSCLIELTDIYGKRIEIIEDAILAPGKNEIHFTFPEYLSTGNYLLHINSASSRIVSLVSLVK
ncbi:MAG TPA: T9SS type A sorting domain-containing protein [Chitinophagales bacterium]|nr:T9SS type A sorting domain-containing protein [Chitinophagales bacterium]HRG87306.1 T9SS type A sorting domain-containing protein [Chitinophagales bacterium]